ncbi:RHS repeat-associated core domain-containing protein [Dokdonella soli]|uniref:RHS repeat-associated core domain-containing protein n=1 Tax=Dokdonella soli TaxID=529810 RepID=A0ABP3TMV7_9GAMM
MLSMLCLAWNNAIAGTGWCKDDPANPKDMQAEQQCLVQQARTAASLGSAYFVAQCQITAYVQAPAGNGSGRWGYDYQLVGDPLPPPPNWVQQWSFYCAATRYSPDENNGNPACHGSCVGDPINAGTAGLFLEETDLHLGRWLNFTRYYNSDLTAGSTIGHFWRHTYSRKVDYSGTAPTSVVVRHEDGKGIPFSLAGGHWSSDLDIQDTLTEQADASGNATGWTHVRADTLSTEQYDGTGKLLSITDAQGFVVTLTYSTASTPSTIAPAANYLITVTDPTGRALQFTYSAAGALSTMTDPSGQVYQYGLSSDGNGNLGSMTYPGGASPRTYQYNEAAHTQSTSLPAALTGVTDENTARYTTIDYDTSGNAIGTQHANGADKFTLVYNSDGSSDVTDPKNNTTHHTFTVVNNVVKASTLSGPSIGFSNGASRSYDSYSNPTSITDFNGFTTCYTFDQTHGLETSRTEGVTTGCSGTPSGLRTIQTDWDTNLRMPTERRTYNASGGLEARTHTVYNARRQVTARCEIDPADTAAMAYTCSATTAPAATAKVRRWVTTYCEQADVTAGTCPLIGLVTSVNGPRPAGDVGMAAGQDDLTIYTYYPTDDATCASNGACPHRHGDLWKVTNALGQVTTTVSYDKNGRVTRMQDANGTFTDFLYHPRGWLTDRIVRASATGASGAGDATTHIDYDAVGNVTKVTQPDGDFLAYTYDAAHRLLKITDALNNVIDYCPGGVGTAQCLDAAGNRLVEQVKDPSGAIKRNLSRTYNTLNQLTQVANAANAPTISYPASGGYDGNGNPTLSTDGLGYQTQQAYDGLNRLKATIQNYNGTDLATKNTETDYTYDTRDNLRQVTDPDLIKTIYDYDGLNNLTGLHSHDTGDTGYHSDAAGNRTSQTDARGVTSNYTYDALNRLTAITYPTASLNVTYSYDQSNSTTGCATSYPIGRLTQMTDSTGHTTYCYDRRGNVLSKVQLTLMTASCNTAMSGCGGSTSSAVRLGAGVGLPPTPNPTTTTALTLTTQYSYTRGDRLASITYPGGAVVTYGRDAVDRVTLVQWQANATATKVTVIANATYYPFGPLNVLTYGNNRTLTKTYDQDYAIHTIASSATSGLTLGFGVDVMGNLTNASASLAPPVPDRQYGYDPLYRLTSAQTGATPPVPLEGYAYDHTGDRTSASLSGQGAIPYTYTGGTHHLASVGGVARTYDLNGNTTSSGLSYDDRNRLQGWNLVGGQINLIGYSALYGYNGRGERVSKQGMQYAPCNPPSCYSIPGAPVGWQTGTVAYSYDESGQLLSEVPDAYSTSVGGDTIYLDTTPIAVVRNGKVYAIETDQLGTPRLAFDPTTNATVWSWDALASTFGTNAPTGSLTLNLRFPGQYYDQETGLNYNYFRDYEPGTGRYVEADPVGIFGGMSVYRTRDYSPSIQRVTSADLIGFRGQPSLYGYAGTDPFFYIDPLGLAVCPTENGRYAWCNASQNPDSWTTTNKIKMYFCKKSADKACSNDPTMCCEADYKECTGDPHGMPPSSPEEAAKMGPCEVKYFKCAMGGGN